MKKIIKKIATFVAAFLVVFSLVSCNKANAVKKAFEKEGYTVTTTTTKDNANAKSLLQLAGLTEDQMKEADKYEIILCVKGLNTAAVLKFPSNKDVKEFYTVEDENGKKDTSAYDNAKDKGYINNNCVIFTASSASVDIFKKA